MARLMNISPLMVFLFLGSIALAVMIQPGRAIGVPAPAPAPVSYDFLKECASKLEPCGYKIYLAVFGNGKLSDECCGKLVRTGKVCHDDLVKHLIADPSFKGNAAQVLAKSEQDSIYDHGLSWRKSASKDMPIDKHSAVIHTTVTSSAEDVDRWLSKLYHAHSRRWTSTSLVGLDIEWRPYYPPSDRNPVAIMQICIGHHCLIFQLLHANTVPESLVHFLANPVFTFVGVGVKDDADKLIDDYKLGVGCTLDLAQTAYVCIDAYVSFELGMFLMNYSRPRRSSNLVHGCHPYFHQPIIADHHFAASRHYLPHDRCVLVRPVFVYHAPPTIQFGRIS
ncbi:hypothetical protein FNV43_RR01670 [Rhamnella rubrinervis]|uniref:3'-5' exonuclease domain-containing protein n=1 Tax=Rhamnella rubrinervis TaxID=2594499 RepID=A0A8K0MT71_9ROSA|nr:hypothetical protein FNV43_RR01670 [Rhamnella rubrinervis]